MGPRAHQTKIPCGYKPSTRSISSFADSLLLTFPGIFRQLAMLSRGWLLNCTSSTCTSTAETLEPLTPAGGKTMLPENHDYYPTSSLISDTSSTSLHSETSLQTDISTSVSLPSFSSLPSIPSIQKDLPELSLTGVCFTCLSSLRPYSTSIHSLCLSSNLLYISTSNENISVYNIDSLKQITSFGEGDGAVKSIVISSNKIYTAHQDSKIRIWENSPGKKQHQLVASLPTLKDRLLRFASPSNYVQVRRHKKHLWIDHADAVSGIAVNRDLLYSVSWDKSLKIWRVSDLKCLESINKAHDDAINAIVVSGDGFVYTGSADRRIKVWGRATGEKKNKKHSLIATLERHKSAINALALSSDGNVLYSGACDRSILVWEREDSAQHMTVTGALRGHRKAVLCLVYVKDVLFSGSADRTVRIWQRIDGNGYGTIAVLEGHEKPIKALTTRFNGSSGPVTVYSGGLDGEIKVWQVWASNLKGTSSSNDLLECERRNKM